MNPFTHSTVARPLSSGSPPEAAQSRRHDQPRRRRMLFGSALGLLAGAPASALAIDVNSATSAQLQTLHGIGPRTAQIIVEERKRAGPYESLEDLSDRVRGIGPRKVARLRAAGLRLERRYVDASRQQTGSISSFKMAPRTRNANGR